MYYPYCSKYNNIEKMSAVNAPIIEKIRPTVAMRFLSERLPNNPNTIPPTPKIIPNAGTNPVQKLSTPKATANKA